MFGSSGLLQQYLENTELYKALHFLSLPEVMPLLSGYDGKAGSYSAKDLQALVKEDNKVDLPLSLSMSAMGLPMYERALPTLKGNMLTDQRLTAGLELLTRKDAETGVTAVQVLSNLSDEGGLKSPSQLETLSQQDLATGKALLAASLSTPGSIFTLSNLCSIAARKALETCHKEGIVKKPEKDARQKPVNPDRYEFFNLNNGFSPYARLKQKLAFTKPDATERNANMEQKDTDKLNQLMTTSYAQAEQAEKNWLAANEAKLSSLPETIQENLSLSKPPSTPVDSDVSEKTKSTDNNEENLEPGNIKTTTTPPDKAVKPSAVKDNTQTWSRRDDMDIKLENNAEAEQQPANELNVKETLTGCVRSLAFAKQLSQSVSQQDKAQQSKTDTKKDDSKDLFNSEALERCMALLQQVEVSLSALSTESTLNELTDPLKKELKALKETLTPLSQKFMAKNKFHVKADKELKAASAEKNQLVEDAKKGEGFYQEAKAERAQGGLTQYNVYNFMYDGAQPFYKSAHPDKPLFSTSREMP